MSNGYEFVAPVPPTKQKPKRKGVNTLIVLAVKSTKLLKVVKTAKILKPAITVFSAMASIIVYAISLGWAFAAGLVGMLFIHEMGHVLALKRKGFKSSAPLFIPMLGAVVFAPEMGDRDDEAYIGIAGPVIGTLGALPILGAMFAGIHLPEAVILTGYVAVILNLFNLIPIRPLDGGRVTQAIGPWFKWVGIGLLLGLTIGLKSAGLVLIWILVLDDFTMPAFRKMAFGIFLWVLMGTLFLIGWGQEQYLVLYIVDLILGAIFISLYWARWKYIELRKAASEDRDNRKQLSVKRRWIWTAYFFALLIALVGLLVLSHGYLPAGATR